MPDRRRKVFILSRFEGKNNSEIAQIMGISKKTVENHMNLVLKELRKITKVIAIFF
jgi:RNA polymerase sigma-70 factor (ECF subfamily)